MRLALLVLLATATLASTASAQERRERAAPRIGLALVRIDGPIDLLRLSVLDAAVRAARDRREGLVVELDSPGGDLAVGRLMLLRIALAPIPVVIAVPRGGQVAGAALLPLLGASLISIAPDARVGTARGLGGDPTRRLGDFGSRLLMAAREDRSAAIDWLVVSLAEGSVIDGRGARSRGLSTLSASSGEAAAQRLAGAHVDIVMTGEPRTVTGPSARVTMDPATRVALAVRTPFVTTLLAIMGMLVVALGISTGGSTLIILAGSGITLIAVTGPHALPIEPIAIVPLAFGALAATVAPRLAPYVRGQAIPRGAIARAVVALGTGLTLLAIGAMGLVSPDRAGWYVGEGGAMSPFEAAAMAVLVALPAVAWSRLVVMRCSESRAVAAWPSG